MIYYYYAPQVIVIRRTSACIHSAWPSYIAEIGMAMVICLYEKYIAKFVLPVGCRVPMYVSFLSRHLIIFRTIYFIRVHD